MLPCYQDGAGGTVVFTLQGNYRDRREISWLVKKLASFYNINLLKLRRQCSRLLNLKRYVSLPFSSGMVLLPVKTRQAKRPGETTVGYFNLLQVAKILPAVDSPQRAKITAAFIPGPGPGGGGAAQEGARTAGLPNVPPAGDARVAEPRNNYPAKKGFPQVSWKTDAPAPPTEAVAAEPVWLSRVQFKCGLQVKTLNTPETMRERVRQGKAVLEDYHKRQQKGTPFRGFNSQKLLGELPDCNCFLKDIFKNFLNLRNSKN